MSVTQRLAAELASLMHEDPRRVLLGEDVLDGGLLGLSRAARADEGLRDRVIGTPLVPSVAFAHAAGLAIGGARPIVVLPGTQPLIDGLAGLREAARVAWRTEGQRIATMLVIAPTGPGFGIGGDAGEGIEAVLARVPGLSVWCASSAEDAVTRLRGCVRDAMEQGPTVLLLPRAVLREADSGAEADDTADPCVTRRDGAALAVLAWGEAVGTALQAVEHAQADAAVIDVARLVPLPMAEILAAVRPSGRVVIAHGGPRTGGLGAEIAAEIADAAILVLDAPIVRVAGIDAPVSAADEAKAGPDFDRLVDAIATIAHY